MEQWVTNEMQGANLGHERFRPNVVKILTRLGENPSLSFSAACGSAVRKAANRLFSKESIALQQGHIEQTVQRCREHRLILAIEDTTDVNYDGHKSKSGMGHLGGRWGTRGIRIHSVLCASESGEPLGLMGQYIWPPPKSKGIDVRKLPIEEKESMKWIRLMRAVNETLGDAEPTVVVVSDREGDFYEHFSEFRKANIELLVRGSHMERKIKFLGQECKVNDLPKLSPVAHTYKMTIERQGDRKKREVDMVLRYGKLEYPRTEGRKGETLDLWFVHAVEVNCTGEEPIEWYLFTSINIETVEKAMLMLVYYNKRWIIERFHYVLKTGLRIENFSSTLLKESKMRLNYME